MALKADRLIPFCFQVYLVTNKVNGKKYVGKTSYPLSFRRYGHKSAHDRDRGSVLHKAISKYGWDNFDMKTLYECVDEREMNAVERALIAEYNTLLPNGYNVTTGGDGGTGYSPTPETVEKIAAQLRGRKRPDVTARLKGVPRTPEVIAKISAAKKGKPLHANTRAAQIKAVTGKPCPESTKEALRRALTGKKKPYKPYSPARLVALHARTKKIVGRAIICTTTDTIYASTRHASVYMGIHRSHISMALNGKVPHAKGHTFVYAEAA